MILVYNDHTDADPNPVKLGDPVQLPDVGTVLVVEIDEARQRVYVLAMGHKVLAPLNHVHARWVEGPKVEAAEPTLDQLHENLMVAHRAYFEALRKLIPKEIV